MYGSRPLSKLEAAVYIIVISAVVLVMLDRMQAYFAYAERATVESTLLRTQSALHTRLAFDLLRGTMPDADTLSARNPFEWARMDLVNFAGIRNSTDAGEPEPGKWYFDPALRQIVYAPQYSRGLTIEGGGAVLRFRLVLGGPGALPQLVPASAYRWEP